MSTGCGSEQNAHAARQFPPARGTRGDTDFPPAAVCSPYNRTRLLLRSDPTGKHSSPKTRSQCHPHPQPRPHLHPCPQPHPCPHPREPNPSSQARTEALPEGPPGQHTDAPPGDPRSATPAHPRAAPGAGGRNAIRGEGKSGRNTCADPSRGPTAGALPTRGCGTAFATPRHRPGPPAVLPVGHRIPRPGKHHGAPRRLRGETGAAGGGSSARSPFGSGSTGRRGDRRDPTEPRGALRFRSRRRGQKIQTTSLHTKALASGPAAPEPHRSAERSVPATSPHRRTLH